jgi:hypothetical protein
MSNSGGTAILGVGLVAPKEIPTTWPQEGVSPAMARADATRLTVEDEAVRSGSGLSARNLKKMDRMAMLAVNAARRALGRSKISSAELRLCGILTGNTVGGWAFTEPELRKLYSSDSTGVSPYLASAWFPAASQGQISIHAGVLGYAKTIATDRCAGTQAIGLACESIRSGRGIHFLAGGAEAPLTPFVEHARTIQQGATVTLTEAAAYLLLGPPGPDSVAEIVDYVSFTLPKSPCGRIEESERRLGLLQARNPDLLSQYDLLLDSGLSGDRQLLEHVGKKSTNYRSWWTADVIGDALAASGPVIAAAIYERFARTCNADPAIILSLGQDFASALVLTKSRQIERQNSWRK